MSKNNAHIYSYLFCLSFSLLVRLRFSDHNEIPVPMTPPIKDRPTNNPAILNIVNIARKHCYIYKLAPQLLIRVGIENAKKF